MPHCAVKGCPSDSHNKTEEQLKFFSFPPEEELRNKWIEACFRGKPFLIKYATICSKHFSEDYRVKLPELTKRGNKRKKARDLAPNAVPTLCLPQLTNFQCLPQQTNIEQTTKLGTTKIVTTKIVTTNSNNSNKSVSAERDAVGVHFLADCTSTENDVMEISLVKPEKEKNLPKDYVTLRKQLLEYKTKYSEEVEKSSKLSAELANEMKKRSAFSKMHEELVKSYIELNKKYNNALEKCQETKQKLTEASNKCETILHKYFSPGIVRRMMSDNPDRKVHWSEDDIAEAVSLKMAYGSKSYNFMRETLKIPSPGLTTLKTWTKKLNLPKEIGQNSLLISSLNTAVDKPGSSAEIQKKKIINLKRRIARKRKKLLGEGAAPKTPSSGVTTIKTSANVTLSERTQKNRRNIVSKKKPQKRKKLLGEAAAPKSPLPGETVLENGPTNSTSSKELSEKKETSQ